MATPTGMVGEWALGAQGVVREWSGNGLRVVYMSRDPLSISVGAAEHTKASTHPLYYPYATIQVASYTKVLFPFLRKPQQRLFIEDGDILIVNGEYFGLGEVVHNAEHCFVSSTGIRGKVLPGE